MTPLRKLVIKENAITWLKNLSMLKQELESERNHSGSPSAGIVVFVFGGIIKLSFQLYICVCHPFLSAGYSVYTHVQASWGFGIWQDGFK